MPIVLCQDCKKKISDKSGKCPHCGCPVVPLTEAELEKVKKTDKVINNGCLIVMVVIVALIAGLAAWPTDDKETTPYEVAAVLFKNYHSTDEIQSMLDHVMMYHGIEINDANLTKCIDVLVAFRKSSKVGVTEMDILKHMYQNGSSNLPFSDQAAYSFAVLESTK